MLSKKALSISPSPTMAIDSKAKEMKSRGIDVIGFGAGEPDFDTPLHIRDAAVRAIEEGYTRYTPVTGNQELKEAIADKLKIENGLIYDPAQIVVSNGAKHSLFNTLAAIHTGKEAYPPIPKTKNGFALTRIIKDLKNNKKITKKEKKILILFLE